MKISSKLNKIDSLLNINRYKNKQYNNDSYKDEITPINLLPTILE